MINRDARTPNTQQSIDDKASLPGYSKFEVINGVRTPNSNNISVNEGQALLKKHTGKSEGNTQNKVNASLPGYSKWEMVKKDGKTERIYEQQSEEEQETMDGEAITKLNNKQSSH